MSLRRRRPLTGRAARAAEELQRAEARIALLDRVCPSNLVPERRRLGLALKCGERPRPSFLYEARPELGELRRHLAGLQALLSAGDGGIEESLLAERAAELALEAQLAEQVGAAAFPGLAAQRFPLDPALAEQALAWLDEPIPQADELLTLHATDDAGDPCSLLSVVTRRIEAEGLGVRVELQTSLATLAAVARGVVRIRAGAWLSASATRRIALHEVDGHLLPRVSGDKLAGVFAAGSRGASDDEEGRALVLEERAGMFDASRRREIALRYRAVQSVRGGADFWQTAEMLRQHAATDDAVVELACRAHRGGGLGREGVYLGGYLRVAAALSTRPELETLMARGRLAAQAAASLLEDSVELDHDRDVI